MGSWTGGQDAPYAHPGPAQRKAYSFLVGSTRSQPLCQAASVGGGWSASCPAKSWWPLQVMVATSLEGSQMSPESQSHQWQGGLGLASNMTLEF